MEAKPTQQSAFDKLSEQKGDIQKIGDGHVIALDYPCPDCGVEGDMRCEVVGVRGLCWCHKCNSRTYGVHELLGEFVIETPECDFSLRDVPADRVEVL